MNVNKCIWYLVFVRISNKLFQKVICLRKYQCFQIIFFSMSLTAKLLPKAVDCFSSHRLRPKANVKPRTLLSESTDMRRWPLVETWSTRLKRISECCRSTRCPWSRSVGGHAGRCDWPQTENGNVV